MWNSITIIGQAIHKYHKQKVLTQEQLADKIGISYLTKIDAINCNHTFSLKALLNISEVLEISIHQLLKGIE